MTRRELLSLHLYTASGSSVRGGMYSVRVVNVRAWTSKWCALWKFSFTRIGPSTMDQR